MSKLLRTKPSTLCKAHIFLILFLLSVCNPMSVAGAEKADMTPDEANSFISQSLAEIYKDKILSLLSGHDTDIVHGDIFPHYDSVGKFMNQETRRTIGDMISTLREYSLYVLKKHIQDPEDDSLSPENLGIPGDEEIRKLLIPEHKDLQEDLIKAVSRLPFDVELHDKVQELLAFLGHETALLYSLMAVTLNDKPKNKHAIWPSEKQVSIDAASIKSGELKDTPASSVMLELLSMPKGEVDTNELEFAKQFILGEVPKHHDLIVQFLRVQGARFAIQKRVFNDLQDKSRSFDAAFKDRITAVENKLDGVPLKNQGLISKNNSLIERLKLLAREELASNIKYNFQLFDQFNDLQKSVAKDIKDIRDSSTTSASADDRLNTSEIFKTWLMLEQLQDIYGPEPTELTELILQSYSDRHEEYGNFLCFLRQVYGSGDDREQMSIGGFQLRDPFELPFSSKEEAATSTRDMFVPEKVRLSQDTDTQVKNQRRKEIHKRVETSMKGMPIQVYICANRAFWEQANLALSVDDIFGRSGKLNVKYEDPADLYTRFGLTELLRQQSNLASYNSTVQLTTKGEEEIRRNYKFFCGNDDNAFEERDWRKIFTINKEGELFFRTRLVQLLSHAVATKKIVDPITEMWQILQQHRQDPEFEAINFVPFASDCCLKLQMYRSLTSNLEKNFIASMPVLTATSYAGMVNGAFFYSSDIHKNKIKNCFYKIRKDIDANIREASAYIEQDRPDFLKACMVYENQPYRRSSDGIKEINKKAQEAIGSLASRRPKTPTLPSSSAANVNPSQKASKRFASTQPKAPTKPSSTGTDILNTKINTKIKLLVSILILFCFIVWKGLDVIFKNYFNKAESILKSEQDLQKEKKRVVYSSVAIILICLLLYMFLLYVI